MIGVIGFVAREQEGGATKASKWANLTTAPSWTPTTFDHNRANYPFEAPAICWHFFKNQAPTR